VVLIGLLLIGVVLAAGIDVWKENGAHIKVQGFGHSFSQPPWVVLLVGAGCGVLLVIGLGLIARGVARSRRLRREHEEVLRDRDRLAKEIEAERAAHEHPEALEPALTSAGDKDAVLAASNGPAHRSTRRR
jgi:hypothetical protein